MDEAKKVDRPIMSTANKVYIGLGIVGLTTLLITLAYFGFPVKDYISSVATFITANAWPLLLAGLIAVYHKEIRDILERVEEGKLFGGEFKARKKLAEVDAAIQKSYAAIEELRELAVIVTDPIIDTLALTGQLSHSLSLDYKLRHLHNIRDVLRKLGVEEEQIKSIGSIFIVMCLLQHIDAVADELIRLNPDFSYLKENRGRWFVPTARQRATFDNMIAKNNLKVDGEVEEALLDLEHFDKTNKLRRPQKWWTPVGN